MKMNAAPLAGWNRQAPAALIVAEPERMAEHARTIEAAGARLVGQVTPAAADARIAQQIMLEMILFDATGLSLDSANATASKLSEWAVDRDCRLIAVMPSEALDAVAAPLLASNATLLCDARPSEHAAALISALPSPTGRLHDSSRERESERLRLLHEEVARLAEVLNQLTTERQNRTADASLNNSGATTEPHPSPRTVRAAIRARRLRDHFFHADLFADPAWDMLLDLYAARLERRRVSVSSLCIAAAVPPTTALRWITTMHEAGLFTREPDPHDKRRAHIMLTERAADAMRGYFAQLQRIWTVAE